MDGFKNAVFILLLFGFALSTLVALAEWGELNRIKTSSDFFNTGTLIVLLLGTVVVVLLVFSIVRSYSKTGNGGGEDSQVGFVVDTFHQTVAQLKEKERELDSLRRLAEDRVEVVEGYNENILESVPSGVMSVDEDGIVTKINSSGAHLLGIDRTEIKGKRFSELLTGRLGEIFERESTVERGEAEYLSPSGRRIQLGLAINPLLDADKKRIGKLIVFTDLTELKALEAQAELRHRLSSLGEMAAGMAHELRNPMAVISGYTKLLSRKSDDGSKKTVDAISAEVEIMNKIINDFLDFVKPPELNRSISDIKEIVIDALRIIEDRADIVTKTDLPEGMSISADALLLRQAFSNLVRNSAEAMPAGGAISVSCRMIDGAVELLFSDSGGGIPEAIRQKVFLPFFTTKEKGTGLGLALAHRIIEQHGGFTEIVGSSGGTSVRVVLPIDVVK